jgi:hypothetical protein
LAGWWSGIKLPLLVPGSVEPQVWQPVSFPMRFISPRSVGVKSRCGPRAGIDSSACGKADGLALWQARRPLPSTANVRDLV